jgi:hypothetical protein
MALTSLSAAFKDTTGGIKSISFCAKANLPSVTLTAGDMGTISTGSSNLLTISCLEYHGDANWEMKDKDAVNYVDTVIDCVAVTMTTANLLWLRTMAASSGIVAFITFYNGEKLCFGWDNIVGSDAFLRLTKAKGSGGKAPQDMVSVSFSLTGTQKETPYTFTSVS